MVTDYFGNQALLRLMTWLSPAFPVGGFAYSSGLEGAVHDGLLKSDQDLQEWLCTLIYSGSMWNDLVLLAHSHRCATDDIRLKEVLELAEALAGSQERYQEIKALGEAFVFAARAWPNPIFEHLERRPPYCVAVGAIASVHEIAIEPTAAAFLHAALSQSISASIRLGVIGQRQGVSILAKLEPDALDVAERAARSSLDDLGSATVLADISIMRHEEQHSRLFRS